MRRFPRPLFAVIVFAVGLAATSSSARAAGMFPDNPGSDATEVRGDPIGTIDVATNLSMDEVRDIVAYSLAARNWTVTEKSEQRVIGRLNHRGYDATITFLLNPTVIEIYCDGYRVSKSGVRKKPAIPERWIANLRKDIPKRMSLEAATK